MLTRDRLATALARLDPASRALLELSARRGLSEQQIGELLAMKPEEIRLRRQEGMARLGAELGLGPGHSYELHDQLSRLEESEWRGEEPNPEAARTGGRRTAAVIAVSVLLIVATTVVALVLGSGDRDKDRKEPSVSTSEKDGARTVKKGKPPAPISVGRVLSMERLNDTRGSGTAQIRRAGGRAQVRLRVQGFLRPRGGGYAVWLFNSRDDARRLYATDATAIRRDIPLPKEVGRYRFVEVARAVPRLNSRHSGLTLLRAPVSELAKRRR